MCCRDHPKGTELSGPVCWMNINKIGEFDNIEVEHVFGALPRPCGAGRAEQVCVPVENCCEHEKKAAAAQAAA